VSHETYIAQSDRDTYFIKLGAHIAYYQVMASLDLTPAVVMAGTLEDDTSVMLQPYITLPPRVAHNMRLLMTRSLTTLSLKV
jgi:hypothetical protein